jgi:hypothetical protein
LSVPNFIRFIVGRVNIDIPNLKLTLLADQEQTWSQNVPNYNRLDIYAVNISLLESDKYAPKIFITAPLNRSHRSIIAGLVLGTFPLQIELGRYDKIPRDERYCPLCLNTSEDQFHFLFVCPFYNQDRHKLFQSLGMCNMTNDQRFAKCLVHPFKFSKYISALWALREKLLKVVH